MTNGRVGSMCPHDPLVHLIPEAVYDRYKTTHLRYPRPEHRHRRRSGARNLSARALPRARAHTASAPSTRTDNDDERTDGRGRQMITYGRRRRDEADELTTSIQLSQAGLPSQNKSQVVPNIFQHHANSIPTSSQQQLLLQQATSKLKTSYSSLTQN